MPVNKIIFLQQKKLNFNNLDVAIFISEKLQKKLILYLIDIPQEEKEKAVSVLSSKDVDFDIKNQLEFDEATEEIEAEKPDLLIVTQEKISPLEHIFKITTSEKLVKKLENLDIIMLKEDEYRINKVLINIDKESSTPYYIKSAYLFASKLGVDFNMITSFYESFYENRLRKTHPDEEAKQLVAELFKEHIDTVKRKIAEALSGEEAELIIIKGDPKKEIPYYARTHEYDLLVINEDIKDRESYIENSETSISIFKDKE
ncbi:hypothetical protein SAMN06265182_1196 [Persephonella hydrogeniphila]|uniref:Universal stress protein family protein n=1 Tax=Persephonella hydrogeniphila TaxID=198703 RepID=A0A285NF85_9AQUI|nr:universal stress protein [Persephonella hydrogeniphila]SNZ08174.1 hypothetical protein SAMN06265182_1196 [Persephonella hydrogeniphila]